MSQDERYKKAVHEFYGAYRELQKRMNLRMASHFSMYTDKSGNTGEKSKGDLC